MSEMLFLMVEGNDDERFFDKIIKPLFYDRFEKIKIWQHAQKSRETIEKMLLSINNMQADYIYIEDLDQEKNISIKKSMILKKTDYINQEKIAIVVKEIESWYLAGLSRKDADELGIAYVEQTDNIYKEDFNKLISLEYDSSRINTMHEILKCYSINLAQKRNNSFAYFIDNFVKNV
ncbi:MAG: hypothetical protein ACOC4G_00600 [Bacillota bacterium]